MVTSQEQGLLGTKPEESQQRAGSDTMCPVQADCDQGGGTHGRTELPDGGTAPGGGWDG